MMTPRHIADAVINLAYSKLKHDRSEGKRGILGGPLR
jgi:hypothetical protein